MKVRKVGAAHAQQKPFKRSWFKGLAAGVCSVLVAVVAVGGWYVWDTEQNLKNNSVVLGDVDEQLAAVDAPGSMLGAPVGLESFEGDFTVLLVGNDSGDGNASYGSRDHALNDVNILIHITEDHKTATAISLPRDLIVDMPDCVREGSGEVVPGSVDKINSALGRGGLACAVEAVESVAGVQIDNAVMVGFDGVIALSNAIGGVPVCLTEPINDTKAKLSLEAGEHVLVGDEALGFLRTRYGVGDGSDLSRISNQQVFLSSLIRELKKKETLTDVTKVLKIADAVSNNTVLSSNLASVSVLSSLAYGLKDLELSNVTFVQVPTGYEGNGVVLKTEEAAVLFDAVFSGKNVDVTGGTGPGEVGSVKVENPEKETKVVDVNGNAGIPVEGAVSDSEGSSVVEEESARVALPDSVRGQTADEYTCSKGYIG